MNIHSVIASPSHSNAVATLAVGRDRTLQIEHVILGAVQANTDSIITISKKIACLGNLISLSIDMQAHTPILRIGCFIGIIMPITCTVLNSRKIAVIIGNSQAIIINRKAKEITPIQLIAQVLQHGQLRLHGHGPVAEILMA